MNPSRGIASRRRKIRSFGHPFRESGTVKHHAFWMRLFDRDPIMSFNFSPRAIICNLTSFLSLRLGFAPAPSTNSQNISPRNTSRIAFHFRCDPNLHPAHIRHVQSGQPFKARGNGHTRIVGRNSWMPGVGDVLSDHVRLPHWHIIFRLHSLPWPSLYIRLRAPMQIVVYIIVKWRQLSITSFSLISLFQRFPTFVLAKAFLCGEDSLIFNRF